MEFTGKIIQVLPVQGGTSSKTGNAWSKLSFVVEEIEKQYPKKALFEVFGEDKYKAMPIVAGNNVTVSFDVEASEYNGRWYNTLKAWRVLQLQEPQPEQQTVLPPPPPANPNPSALPF